MALERADKNLSDGITPDPWKSFFDKKKKRWKKREKNEILQNIAVLWVLVAKNLIHDGYRQPKG